MRRERGRYICKLQTYNAAGWFSEYSVQEYIANNTDVCSYYSYHLQIWRLDIPGQICTRDDPVIKEPTIPPIRPATDAPPVLSFKCPFPLSPDIHLVSCEKTTHVRSDDKSVIGDGDNHSDGDDAVVVTTRVLPRPGITIMMFPISHNA